MCIRSALCLCLLCWRFESHHLSPRLFQRNSCVPLFLLSLLLSLPPELSSFKERPLQFSKSKVCIDFLMPKRHVNCSMVWEACHCPEDPPSLEHTKLLPSLYLRTCCSPSWCSLRPAFFFLHKPGRVLRLPQAQWLLLSQAFRKSFSYRVGTIAA